MKIAVSLAILLAVGHASAVPLDNCPARGAATYARLAKISGIRVDLERIPKPPALARRAVDKYPGELDHVAPIILKNTKQMRALLPGRYLYLIVEANGKTRVLITPEHPIADISQILLNQEVKRKDGVTVADIGPFATHRSLLAELDRQLGADGYEVLGSGRLDIAPALAAEKEAGIVNGVVTNGSGTFYGPGAVQSSSVVRSGSSLLIGSENLDYAEKIFANYGVKVQAKVDYATAVAGDLHMSRAEQAAGWMRAWADPVSMYYVDIWEYVTSLLSPLKPKANNLGMDYVEIFQWDKQKLLIDKIQQNIAELNSFFNSLELDGIGPTVNQWVSRGNAEKLRESIDLLRQVMAAEPERFPPGALQKLDQFLLERQPINLFPILDGIPRPPALVRQNIKKKTMELDRVDPMEITSAKDMQKLTVGPYLYSIVEVNGGLRVLLTPEYPIMDLASIDKVIRPSDIEKMHTLSVEILDRSKVEVAPFATHRSLLHNLDSTIGVDGYKVLVSGKLEILPELAQDKQDGMLLALITNGSGTYRGGPENLDFAGTVFTRLHVKIKTKIDMSEGNARFAAQAAEAEESQLHKLRAQQAANYIKANADPEMRRNLNILQFVRSLLIPKAPKVNNMGFDFEKIFQPYGLNLPGVDVDDLGNLLQLFEHSDRYGFASYVADQAKNSYPAVGIVIDGLKRQMKKYPERFPEGALEKLNQFMVDYSSSVNR